MKAKLYRTIFIIAASCSVVSLSGCDRIKEAYGKKDGTAKAAAQETPVFAVNTTAAVKGQINDYIALAGDIIAASTVDTYSDAAGKVTRLFVSIGDRVSKGQRIAEIDPSRPGMTYVASIATAPVSGTVVALPAQVGMTISQAVSLARISSGSGLEIKLYVAERFISRIALRQNCEITLDAWPGEIFKGRVSEISPVIDPASRTMEIRIALDNTGSRLKSGMFAKVKIITEQKNNVVKIPASARVQRFGEEYVFIAARDPADPSGHVARKIIIKPGIEIDSILEIESGLNADDDVIVRGQTLLEDGSRVNVIDRVQPLAAN